MSRAVLQLWPTVARGLVPALAMLAAGLIVGWPFSILGYYWGLLALVGAWRRFGWLRMLAATVRRFRTIRTPSVMLYYSPLAGDQILIRAFVRTVEIELEDLARKFGRPLRRPVAVYLFARRAEVARLLGPQFGGFALLQANAIVLSLDCVWDEFVRHELSHLFAGRWSKLAPPLLQEGLAVWLQGTHYGRRIDDAARAALGRRELPLDVLMDPGRFFHPEYMSDCYTLAGSFTRFLIGRFGWDAYRRLYRRCDGRRFAARFRQSLGMSLDDAHWEWRLELRLGDGPTAGSALCPGPDPLR